MELLSATSAISTRSGKFHRGFCFHNVLSATGKYLSP